MTPLATFRDPAGSLALAPTQAIRTIHPAARTDTLAFLASPFYQSLLQRGEIVATTSDDTPAGLRLLHPLIAVPTYPWEWTPAQWLAAADLTLSLATEAIDAGYTLKDATPLNILFLGSRPVLVDVLSFEPRVSAPQTTPSTIWLAYAQYVRTFLLPLLMHRLLAWPLALSLFHRDGLEPSDCYRALSWPQRLSPAALSPISLPTWLESRKSSSPSPRPAPIRPQDPELTAHILKRTIVSLRKRTAAAVPATASSEWSAYTATLTHYTAVESEAKRAWVRAALEETRPATVLDIGANTGEYSLLAASTGASVIALERDAAAADRLYRRTAAMTPPPDILTIHADFSRPTPAAGWATSESLALIPRLTGRADLILMLAVIHHLILMEQIPLPAILTLVHSLAARYLIVEWVPVSDPMFQSLLRGRDHLYAHLTTESLLAATAGLFTLLRRHDLTNGRILLLFERA